MKKFRLTAAALGAGLCSAAHSAPPIIEILPASASNPGIPHEIIAGRPTTLKAVVDEASVGSTWSWDFGDGRGGCSGTVDANPASTLQTDDIGYNPYWALWCEHSYAGAPGDMVVATLTVDNGVDAPVKASYPMRLTPRTLSSEARIAIDEALWFMHRNQFRFNGSETGKSGAIPMGRWDYPQTSGQARPSVTAASVYAFETNGFTETFNASHPYAETVARGLKYLFARLRTDSTVSVLQAGENADSNGNGFGISVDDSVASFQNGMVMEAIVASGAPNAIATTGPTGVVGRSYRDIVQDMVDYYAWSQNDFGSETGGWIYNPSNNSGQSADNTIGPWAAVGLKAAEDVFGATVPAWVKSRNEVALEAMDIESDVTVSDGSSGYQSISPVWGPFSTTAGAMMQMALDGIPATSSAAPDERWIRAENLFRRHFNDPATGNHFLNYYFAMLLFAKAMRTAYPGPVVVIGANDAVGCGPAAGCAGGTAPLDWYRHPEYGLARTIVDYQIATGVNIGGFSDRPGNSHGSNQDDHNTPWATQVLVGGFIETPVAIVQAQAFPNPAAAGTPVTFDGTASFFNDPSVNLAYSWDFDNDGVTDATGAVVVHAFACAKLPCQFPVTLTVTSTDEPSLITQDTVVVQITSPPHPPVANTGGPYLACAGETLHLDGSGSYDINDGSSDSGSPPFDAITSWGWEIDRASPFDFDDASGEKPSIVVTGAASGLIGLQVTDNTAAAFPLSGEPNLTGRRFTTLEVSDCSCFAGIVARGKATATGASVNVVWPAVAGAVSYDILRSSKSSNSGFSLLQADHETSYATYFDKIAPPLAPAYWYRVRPNGANVCASSAAAKADIGAR